MLNIFKTEEEKIADREKNINQSEPSRCEERQWAARVLCFAVLVILFLLFRFCFRSLVSTLGYINIFVYTFLFVAITTVLSWALYFCLSKLLPSFEDQWKCCECILWLAGFLTVYEVMYGSIVDAMGLNDIKLLDKDAVIAVASLIGIGSIIVTAIENNYSKAELGIQYDRLLEYKFPGYQKMIKSHFVSVILCVFFASISLIIPAIVLLLAVLIDTFLMIKIYEFLLLQPTEKREAAVQCWKKDFDWKKKDEEYQALWNIITGVRYLIAERDNQKGHDLKTYFDCIDYGIRKITNLSEVSIESKIESLSMIWVYQLEKMNNSVENELLREICGRALTSDNSISSDLLLIMLSFNLGVIKAEKPEDYSDFLKKIQKIQARSDVITTSEFNHVVLCANSLLFWLLYLLEDLGVEDMSRCGLMMGVTIRKEMLIADVPEAKKCFKEYEKCVYRLLIGNSGNFFEEERVRNNFNDAFDLAWNNIVE